MRAVGFVWMGDPTDPWEWSGVPKALYDSLHELGHEPVWVDARPSGRVFGRVPRLMAATQVPAAWWSRNSVPLREQAYRIASAGTANAMVLGAIAAVRGLCAATPRDTVQMRSDVVPARRTRTVIFEDAIVDDPPRASSRPRFLWIGLDWARKGGGRAARAHAAILTWRHVAERLVRALDPAFAERLGYSRFLEQ